MSHILKKQRSRRGTPVPHERANQSILIHTDAVELPYFNFYVSDWIRDTRVLTASAKGAWIDILCAMWTSPERGTVTLHPSALARMIGLSDDGVVRVLNELTVEHQVCDRENLADGKIRLTSRRMVRDAAAMTSRHDKLSAGAREANRKRWGSRSAGDQQAISRRQEGESPRGRMSEVRSQIEEECGCSAREPESLPVASRSAGESGGTSGSVMIPPLSRADFDSMAAVHGVPAEVAEWVWNTHDARGWTDTHGQPIRNVAAVLRGAKVRHEERRAKETALEASKRIPAPSTPHVTHSQKWTPGKDSAIP